MKLMTSRKDRSTIIYRCMIIILFCIPNNIIMDVTDPNLSLQIKSHMYRCVHNNRFVSMHGNARCSLNFSSYLCVSEMIEDCQV